MRLGVIRTVAVWLAMAATTTAAWGCAGNTASASETASERTEVSTFAGGVNLRARDLPGYKVVIEADGRPSPLDRSIEKCDGGPIVAETDRGIASPLLQKESVPVQTVASEVFRMHSSSTAIDYIKAADSNRGLGCIQRDELQRRASLPLNVRGKIEIAALRPPLGGTPASGVRIWKCLIDERPCSGDRSQGFTDRLWFAAGPYVVALFYIAGARNGAGTGAPEALPVERRLIALLYSRARAKRS
ncbi:MAG TPA: hypothetical protein VGF47_03270 [Solirubrobacteraceae bacterium]|jgi:hypothetical protein